jgi:hypothetical protein
METTMANQTEAIIEMFLSERPQAGLIKAQRYKEIENPFEVFREWSEKFFNVTRTKQSTTEIDDVTSVSFYDPSIDLTKVNAFIKSL